MTPMVFRQFRVAGSSGMLAGQVTAGADESQTPVLFIHPINLRGACWEDVVTHLPGRRTCLLPDLRGHGASTPAGPFGLDEWVDDCVAVLDHFAVPRAHVVGASLGGPLAVGLAARFPDRVASIAAFGAALAIRGDDVSAVLTLLREKGVRGMFADAIPRISVAPNTPGAIVERILGMTNPNDVDTVASIWGATITADATPLAAQVRCPALVVTGEYDITCTLEQGEEMAKRLESEFVVMSGVGHLPMVEAPLAVAELLALHLRDVA
jgi:pimeloyl-ACP methyl ester carboxylesterase